MSHCITFVLIKDKKTFLWMKDKMIIQIEHTYPSDICVCLFFWVSLLEFEIERNWNHITVEFVWVKHFSVPRFKIWNIDPILRNLKAETNTLAKKLKEYEYLSSLIVNLTQN